LRNYRGVIRWALVALIAAVALVLEWAPASFSAWSGAEHLVKDPIHRLLASDEADPRVVIVDVDEASIARLGSWPWPRARVADLLEALVGAYGVRAVGVDIVFPAPADSAGDARLAALGEFAPVVFAQALDFVARTPAMVSGQPVFRAPPVPGRWPAAAATGYMANHPGLAQAHCVGNIGLQPDPDGLIRRVPLMANWRGEPTPLLPLAMLACPLQRGGAAGAMASLAEGVPATGEWPLPFARHWSAYAVLPASAILDGSAPRELLRDRWVLIGSTALGLNDRAATPLAAVTSGVMVHAAALTSLLDRLEGTAAPLAFDGRWLATLWIVLTLGAGAWALGRYKAS
jgi:adenylate cyclase